MSLSKSADRELVQAAFEVRDRAYAPYSEFAVGAAVLSEDGQIYTGCNVENASYGLSVCAERNAIAAAVAHGGRRLESIAVASGTSPPTAPCGACRQVLIEFKVRRVILANLDGELVVLSTQDLIPLAFDSTSLRTDS